MSIDVDRERLSPDKMLGRLQLDPSMTDMITVYFWDNKSTHLYSIDPALIPTAQIEGALSHTYWDLLSDQGIPDSVVYHEDGEKRVKYLRYGSNNIEGIEPLVIYREFDGIRDNYCEICEDFRLFHGLYHDRKQDKYIKIAEDGNEDIVAVVKQNCVQIRRKEICQFLAIKEMYLSIQFDFRENSEHTLEELGFKEGCGYQRKGRICWKHCYGNSNSSSYSFLQGKHLIPPLPKSKSGFRRFEEEREKEYVEFIIDMDENGEEIQLTSNPDALKNSLDYLTPVHFRKQVLDKYYGQPSKYSVGSSMVNCGNLWNLPIYNHHDDIVCVSLGDLGQSLSYREQQYWRIYNIPPGESGVSETYLKSQLYLEFVDSEPSDHLFNKRYHELSKACEKYLGWQLLQPLGYGDEHYLQCLRIPATDEQRDFDELVLGLTKILIDSLNEKCLNKLIPAEKRSALKGSITRLEAALSACDVEDAADHVSFLRELQKLRSSGAAHRKGSNYREIASDFGIDDQSLRSVFSGILKKALAVLDYFITIVRSGRIKKNEQA